MSTSYFSSGLDLKRSMTWICLSEEMASTSFQGGFYNTIMASIICKYAVVIWLDVKGYTRGYIHKYWKHFGEKQWSAWRLGTDNPNVRL